MSSQQKQNIKKRLFLIFIVVGFLGIAGWLLFIKNATHQNVPPLNLTIAVPARMGGGAIFVAKDQMLFEKHALNISIQPALLGKQALQSVLEGKADLAILTVTPFMFAVMKGEKVATVATVFSSRKTMAIVARKERGIHKAEDLKGKTVGSTFGSNSQYFLDTLLLTNSVEKSSVKIIDFKPEEIDEAFKSGKVDAITARHPELAELEQALGNDATTIYDEDTYVYRFILVGKQDYLDTHASEIRRLLAAIEEANQFIHENPSQSQIILGKAFDMDKTMISKSFYPNDFNLTLDQTLLLSMSDETRWAMKQGIVPSGPVPNYLNYIRQEHLESVLPSSITIIR